MAKANPTNDRKLRELVLFIARTSERDEHFGATKLNKIVQDVIRKLWDLNATGVSELSHEFLGWQLAAEGEEIPYSTALLGRPRPPTPAEVEHGRHLI